jgi:hypothetical protein
VTKIDHRKLRRLDLLTDVRELIVTVEGGKAEAYLYTQMALKIQEWMRANPTLTQGDVADMIGKGRSWVGEVLTWHKGGVSRETPFARGDWSRRTEVHERLVPTRHKDRVEMATKLLADPKVAKAAAKTVLNTSTPAGRVLAQAAHDAERAQRQKDAERNLSRRQGKAMPLPAHMAKMVMQMNEWTRGMNALREDIDDLPEGRGRELVAKAAGDLAEEAWWWADRLQPGKPKLRVIES